MMRTALRSAFAASVLSAAILLAAVQGAAAAKAPTAPAGQKSPSPSAAAGKRGPIAVSGAWIREAPPGAEVLAAYMEIRNSGAREDVLLEARTPIAEIVSIHRTVMKGGVARMEHLESIRIPAKSTVRLRPGGDHLMIMFPERLPRGGQKVPMALRFRRAGTVWLEVPVRPDLFDLLPTPFRRFTAG